MISLTLIWKNSMRKKMRFTLTVLSVVIAFFLFATLAGIDHALTASIDNSNQFRLMTSHKISLTRSMPVNYRQKIVQLPGVEDVAYSSWFGGFFKNEEHQLAVTAVSAENYFSLFPEFQIDKKSLNNWQNNRIGLVVGQTIADKYQWQVGDRLSLQSSIWMNKQGSFTWDFVISAIYRGGDEATDTSKVFFQHEYFDQARAYSGNTAGWFSTQVSPLVNVDRITQAIDRLFANSIEATRTTTEQVFIKEQAQQFADMAKVIKWVLAAVFFTLMLIVCNTMILALRERLNEIAMMKALGFSSLELSEQVFIESLFLLSLGAMAGTLLAKAGLLQVKQSLAEFLPGVAIQPEHYFMVLVLVVCAAIFCSLAPAYSIKKLIITDTLGANA